MSKDSLPKEYCYCHLGLGERIAREVGPGTNHMCESGEIKTNIKPFKYKQTYAQIITLTVTKNIYIKE